MMAAASARWAADEQKAAAKVTAAANKAAATKEKAAARMAAASDKAASRAMAAAAREDAAQKRAAAAADKAAKRETDKTVRKIAQQEKAAKAAKEASDAAQAEGPSFGMLASKIGSIGPEVEAIKMAMVIWTAVITAIAAPLIAGAVAAIEMSEKIAQLHTVLNALGGGAAGGEAAFKVIQSLGKSLPFATSQIADWAKSLMSAGFQGEHLKSAIEAVAAATAIMGESGGAAAEKMLKQLQEGGDAATKMISTIQKGGKKAATLLADMGLQTTDLAAAMGMTVAQFQKAHLSAEQMQKAVEKALQKKGKGPLEEMALTFPVILMKAKEGLMSLFAKLGPAVKPFMKAIKELFGNFNKGTGGIKALQKVFTEVFGTIFKYATMAVKVVAKFVKENFTAKNVGSVWASIKSAIKTVVTTLTPVIAVLKLFLTNSMALKGIKTVLVVIIAVIGFVVGIFVLLAATVVTVAGVIIGGVASFVGFLVGGAQNIIAKVGELIDYMSGAGGSITDGLVGGLDPGAFISKMASMASQGLAAFKSILGIASRSKVMMKMGGFAAEGASAGLEKGADKVGDSAAKLGGAAVGGAAGGMAGGKGGKGGSVSVTFADGAIRIDGAGKSAMQITEQMLELVFERLAASQGV